MKSIAFAFLASCLVSGCTSTTATHDDSLQNREVSYTCANGESLAFRFFPLQGVGVLVRNGQTTELQQHPSGSGFLFSNGGSITVHGKGDDITVEIGRMVPIQCTAR